jgi:hypothetical protein
MERKIEDKRTKYVYTTKKNDETYKQGRSYSFNKVLKRFFFQNYYLENEKEGECLTY